MILNYKSTPVFYRVKGRGKALVLIHGFLENSKIWKPYLNMLSQRNTVVLIDLPGHGKTGCLGTIHTMNRMAEIIRAVLVHLKIKKATFIGHSMGGYVALAYAEKYVEDISGLLLMNSTTMADSEARKRSRNRAIVAVKHHYRSFVGIAVISLFRSENRERLAKTVNTIKEEAIKTPIQGIIAALEGMKIRKKRTEIARNLHCKKAMILGKKDPILSFDHLIKEAEHIGFETYILPDGHMSYAENESEVRHILNDFLG